MMFKGLVHIQPLLNGCALDFSHTASQKPGHLGLQPEKAEPEGKKINRTQQNNHLIQLKRILRKRHFLNYFPIKPHFQKLYKIESLIWQPLGYQQDSSWLLLYSLPSRNPRPGGLVSCPVTHQSRRARFSKSDKYPQQTPGHKQTHSLWPLIKTTGSVIIAFLRMNLSTHDSLPG